MKQLFGYHYQVLHLGSSLSKRRSFRKYPNYQRWKLIEQKQSFKQMNEVSGRL